MAVSETTKPQNVIGVYGAIEDGSFMILDHEYKSNKDTSFDADIDADTELFSKAITYKISVHQFVDALYELFYVFQDLNLNDLVVLCGSAALHGLYVRGRKVREVDLLIKSENEKSIIDLLSSSEYFEKSKHRSRNFTFIHKKKFLKDTKLNIRLISTYSLSPSVENIEIKHKEYQPISVKSFDIGELILNKISLAFLREKPQDLLDLWLSLKFIKKTDAGFSKLKVHANQGPMSHTPGYPIDIERILNKHKKLIYEWKSLGSVIYPLPDHEFVGNEIAKLLSELKIDSDYFRT